MSSIIVFAPGMAHNKWNHPESYERLRGVMDLFEREGVGGLFRPVQPQLATIEQVQRVHAPKLVELIRRAVQGGGGNLDADTYLTPESYDLALLAVGGCCLAADEIVSGRATNGLALVRPPGHHATFQRFGGFCLFNNVAATARHVQAVHGLKRVAIVDFDVHHGNGTQDIFYEDDSVLFISLHLFSPFFYPGTGKWDEIGVGPGRGYTLNIPFPPEVGDQGYNQAFDQLIWPKLKLFRPELILVSAGFDAHWQDPLAQAALSLTGYAALGRQLLETATQLCQGRILFVLEGGYHLQALHNGLLNLAWMLTGRDTLHDPLGPAPLPEKPITQLLDHLKRLHLLY